MGGEEALEPLERGVSFDKRTVATTNTPARLRLVSCDRRAEGLDTLGGLIRWDYKLLRFER